MSVPRLLVALLEGVGRDDLDSTITPFLARSLGEGRSAPLHRTSIADPGRELVANDLVGELRNLGLEVEQRSIVLRPSWRGDAMVVRQLGRRPAGPADITFLRLTDAARTAARAGSGSCAYQAALTVLDEQLSAVAEELACHGVPAELLGLCVGPMRPTAKTFDPVACLRVLLPRPVRAEVRWERAPGGLLLHCKTSRTEKHLQSVLRGAPFSGHGFLAEGRLAERALRPDQILFLPTEEVAFGRDRIRARLAYLPDTALADGTALLPWAHEHDRATTIPEVAVRILMRGAAMANILDRDRISAKRLPSTPDVDAVLEHDPLHVVED